MFSIHERTDMNGTFPGRIVLVEGDEVDVDLQVRDGRLRLATPFAEIGAWALASVEIAEIGAGAYELAIGEERVTFHPEDDESFAAALSGEGGTGAVGDDSAAFSGIDDSAVAPSAWDHRNEAVPVSDVIAHPGAEAPEDRYPGESPADVEAPVRPESPEPIDAAENEAPVGRFGLSSRRRAAARATLDDPTPQPEPADEAEAARRASSGFVIPGDPGYEFPADAVDTADAPEEQVHFDEELEDSTVADQVLETQRSLRSAQKISKLDKGMLRKVAVGVIVVGVLAGLGFAAPIVWDLVAGGDEPTATPTTEAAPPTTTLPATTVTEPEPTVTEPGSAPVVDSIFGAEVGAFVERWNEVAGEVSPALRFRAFVPSGDFESGFTEWLALLGSVSADGTLDRVTLEIDPAGPGASDQLGIQALGVLIAVVDPSLEPAERAALLAEMGLDVRNPELGGIDGTVEFNGSEYRLRFDDEAVRLFLTVSPA